MHGVNIFSIFESISTTDSIAIVSRNGNVNYLMTFVWSLIRACVPPKCLWSKYVVINFCTLYNCVIKISCFSFISWDIGTHFFQTCLLFKVWKYWAKGGRNGNTLLCCKHSNLFLWALYPLKLGCSCIYSYLKDFSGLVSLVTLNEALPVFLSLYHVRFFLNTSPIYDAYTGRGLFSNLMVESLTYMGVLKKKIIWRTYYRSASQCQYANPAYEQGASTYFLCVRRRGMARWWHQSCDILPSHQACHSLSKVPMSSPCQGILGRQISQNVKALTAAQWLQQKDSTQRPATKKMLSAFTWYASRYCSNNRQILFLRHCTLSVPDSQPQFSLSRASPALNLKHSLNTLNLQYTLFESNKSYTLSKVANPTKIWVFAELKQGLHNSYVQGSFLGASPLARLGLSSTLT